MSTTTSEKRCQACGGKIGQRPATAALSPDGRSTWWMHRDMADCIHCTLCRRLARANRLYQAGRIDLAVWGKWAAWALRRTEEKGLRTEERESYELRGGR